MNIPLESTLLIAAGFINLAFGILIYIRDSSRRDNAFFWMISLNVSLWAFSLAVFEGTPTINLYTNWAAMMLYINAALIPVSFLFFSATFAEEKITFSSYKIAWILASYFVILILVLIPDSIIRTITDTIGEERIIKFGPAYPIYGIYIITFFSFAFIKLLKKYVRAKDNLNKIQIKYIFLGTFIASIIGVTTNLIMPTFGNFNLYWLGPIATILMVVIIGYAIAKYNLWDFKLIVIQLFIFFLISLSFLDILLIKSTSELALRLATFLLTATIGLILIRKLLEEVHDKEQIEKLAENLKDANDQLQKMDKQKSEFINLASHQLRGPVASLKGYSSMILEGSYGPISKKIEDVVTRLSQSSNALALIIDDFLNLSRIERGKIEFNFTEGNLKEVVDSAVEELKQKALDKKLKLTFTAKKGNYTLDMDSEKVRQIVSNLIDNSIKYTPKGSIKVKLSQENEQVLLEVTDTGIGVPPQDMDKLFKKFSRLANANEENIQGTGLGLYLAKEVMNAHNGKIWIESEGQDKGSSFFVEFKTKERRKTPRNKPQENVPEAKKFVGEI